MEEHQYEVKPPLVVIARYDRKHLGSSDNAFGLVPTPEDHAAQWSEDDSSMHYFFVEISTDIASVATTTVGEYQALKAAEAAAQEAENSGDEES